MALSAGTRLGPYEILAPLGAGGMGEVYQAVDTRLRRTVAVKILPEDVGPPQRHERFIREAQAASALNHPGIVTIHDVGHDQGVDFIVMERVEGRTLREILHAGALPVDEALGYARQAAAALAVAHAANIVHRDLKPQNLMITASGQLKILDFGLAHMRSDEADTESPTAERLTTLGAVLGTPGYMSPEQAEGRLANTSTDVFSLGVILYEMLTGRTPFRSTSVAGVLYEIVHREPEPAARLRPELTRDVIDLLDSMLRKDPQRRLANGAEVLAALSGTPPRPRAASPPWSWSRLGGWVRRHRALVASFVILGGAAALTGVLWRAQFSERFAANSTPAPGAATAYDRYLEALDLVKRWDKDDNLSTAIRLFGEAARQDPTFALAFARLADAQRIRYALTHDDSMLAEAMGNAQEAVRLNPGLAPVQVALGRLQAARGSNELALAAFEHALAIDSNSAEAHQAIARQYERLGRLDDAEASYQKAVSLDPDSFDILDSYANFLFRQSRFEDAARRWQAVIRLAPDSSTALINLGSALSESGKIPEAITMFERAVELKPDYMAYSNLGTAYSRAKRYPDAVAAYRKALELNDKDWMVWGNLGYVYSWMHGMDSRAGGAFEHAIRLGEAARPTNSRDAFLHSDLACYYAKTGQARLALERLGTALALAPGTGEIQAAAAEVHERLGHREVAIEHLRKALELGYRRQALQRTPELSSLLADLRVKTML